MPPPTSTTRYVLLVCFAFFWRRDRPNLDTQFLVPFGLLGVLMGCGSWLDVVSADHAFHASIHTLNVLTALVSASDVATRGKADIKDVAYGSTWQTGPNYL